MTGASAPSTSAADIALWPCSCAIPDEPLLLHTDRCWVCRPDDLVGWLPARDGKLWPHGHLSDAPSLSGPLQMYSSPLRMAWPCSRTLSVYIVILLLGHAISATWCFCPPRITLISISTQLFDLCNMAFALHLGLAVTQCWQLSVLPGKWARTISLSTFQLPKRPTRHRASFLVVKAVRYNNLSFTYRDVHAPNHWIPKEFTALTVMLCSLGHDTRCYMIPMCLVSGDVDFDLLVKVSVRFLLCRFDPPPPPHN